ncbi:TrmB family transcriptional regulator [Brevibacillus sp. B_LB10_24]|uniref:TrmB family transcriptional regulator n=1 Tax=Brevibacillus sp. B_LB10_24 TaxID=3380645 RepID=UPI0038B996A1
MLQKFGFSQYESKVYEVLVTGGEPMDAAHIVKHSGVPKAKIYEVLSRMTEKGMIMESVSEKKKLYTALPLPLAIEKLTKEFQDNVKQLKLDAAKKTFTDDRVWSLKVDASIRAQSKQLIQGATSSIRMSAWTEDFSEYAPLLDAKENAGVDVEVLVTGQVITNLTKVYSLIPTQEHEVLERFRLLIVDDREVLFAGEENHSWQAIKTMSKPIVKFFTEFFYHDVTLAKITEKHGELLMKDEEIKKLLMQLRY